MAEGVTSLFPGQVFTRVCHVKSGYEDRERHIVKEFGRRGVPVHFYTDWDKADITPADRQRWVGGSELSGAVLSLALKHHGIWQEFLESGKPYCLVFEDDVFLARDFNAKLGKCIAELGDPDRMAVVYLGNGSNYYVGWKNLKRGQHLYPAIHARCTDSYLITRPVAKARCDWFAANKITTSIDHLIEKVDPEIGVQMLWFERPIVEQGSENGTFRSAIVNKKRRPLWLKRLQWNWKKYRRRFFGHTAR